MREVAVLGLEPIFWEVPVVGMSVVHSGTCGKAVYFRARMGRGWVSEPAKPFSGGESVFYKQ